MVGAGVSGFADIKMPLGGGFGRAEAAGGSRLAEGSAQMQQGSYQERSIGKTKVLPGAIN